MPAPYRVEYGFGDWEIFDKFDDALAFYRKHDCHRLLGKGYDVDVVDDEGNAGLVDDGLSEEEREQL